MIREAFSAEVKPEDVTSGEEKEMLRADRWYAQRHGVQPTQGMTGVIEGLRGRVIFHMLL